MSFLHCSLVSKSLNMCVCVCVCGCVCGGGGVGGGRQWWKIQGGTMYVMDVRVG
jgi:hypothetical protein